MKTRSGTVSGSLTVPDFRLQATSSWTSRPTAFDSTLWATGHGTDSVKRLLLSWSQHVPEIRHQLPVDGFEFIAKRMFGEDGVAHREWITGFDQRVKGFA